jgi:hypothetical protein
MDYVKKGKSIAGFSATRLAMWAVLIVAAVFAGLAVLGSGMH